MNTESTVSDSLGNVLLVEDTITLARTYLGYLRDEPFNVQHVETGAAALEAVEAREPDAILLDLKLPDMDGLDILRRLSEEHSEIPVIVITAHGSVGGAVDAMRLGAVDFLVKPFGEERLVTALENHVDRRQFAKKLEARPTVEAGADEKHDGFEGFVGVSNAMLAVYRAIESASKSSATVFITGESGTGKEVCAQAVHNQSQRRSKNFVPINCAAIPGELMESEIFGHVKGAFTGAVADKMGAAKLADGGTLFLDEICEMSLHLQSKLLRFIQTGTFNPVGKAAVEKVNVRFICATNRDPLEEVSAGRFREDLYYRLHVIPIGLPPLRDRDEDVVRIARDFLKIYANEEGKGFADFAEDAKEALMSYDWPGNVRQLQNVLRNSVVLNDGPLLTAEMFPAPVNPNKRKQPGARPVTPAPAAPTPVAPLADAPAPDDIAALSRVIRPLADIEREAIERAVDMCGGDVRRAAVLLQVSPATIYRKQKAWRAEA